jgi:3D (Asp-Asp-Asp) domain-containing protein
MDLVPVQAYVTAYVPNNAICQTTHITADGTNTNHVPYGIAIDRRVALGTIIYIPVGHGCLDGIKAFDRAFRVDDRGGALEQHQGGPLRIDLRVKDFQWAKRFGRKLITVYMEKQ